MGGGALDPIKILRAFVEEALRIRQVRPRVRILGDPDAHVRVRSPHLSDMTRQAAKVSVPVDRDEIRAAVPSARGEKLLQPCEARLRARHGWGAQLHALRLQGLDFADPRLGRKFGGDVAAAGGGSAVRFVESEDVGDIGASGDLGLDGSEERGVCGVVGGAEEHGHELEIGGI